MSVGSVITATGAFDEIEDRAEVDRERLLALADEHAAGMLQPGTATV